MLETWALEIVLAFATVQLLGVAYLYYRGWHESTGPGSDATNVAPTDDGSPQTVTCDECGAENDPEYHYCRRCVADLSGESIPGYRTHSPSERSL